VDTYDRMRQFEVLSHFTDRQIDQLAGCTSRVHYADRAAILKEGDDSRDVYLIDVGDIEIRRNTPYGSYTLAELKAGDVFGEAAFIDENARSGDVVAGSEVVVFPISIRTLTPLMEADHKFTLAIYWALWKSLSRKLRNTNEALAHFFSKERAPANQREPRAEPADAIHVGVGAKKELFREQEGLSPLEINFLATLSKEMKFGPDEFIFREGEEGDHLYIVLAGRVMISKEIVGAGEEALAFLERGDYFGEMALIDHQPRSADAKAHSEGAVVLAISSEVLEGILDIQKVSSLRLLRILCSLISKRLREIDDKLVGWYIFNAGAGESLSFES
jgi:CRP-like cAMP-binding protein